MQDHGVYNNSYELLYIRINSAFGTKCALERDKVSMATTCARAQYTLTMQHVQEHRTIVHSRSLFTFVKTYTIGME